MRTLKKEKDGEEKTKMETFFLVTWGIFSLFFFIYVLSQYGKERRNDQNTKNPLLAFLFPQQFMNSPIEKSKGDVQKIDSDNPLAVRFLIHYSALIFFALFLIPLFQSHVYVTFLGFETIWKFLFWEMVGLFFVYILFSFKGKV